MPIDIEVIDFLENLFNAVDDDQSLINEWEKKFIDDQKKRYEEYGDRVIFSFKQLDVIKRMAEKYGVEYPKNRRGI